MFSVSIHSCPCFWYKKQGLFCARAIGCADMLCVAAYARSAYGIFSGYRLRYACRYALLRVPISLRSVLCDMIQKLGNSVQTTKWRIDMKNTSTINWHQFKEGELPLEHDSKIESKSCRVRLNNGVEIDSNFKFIDEKPYFCIFRDGKSLVEWIPFDKLHVTAWISLDEIEI